MRYEIRVSQFCALARDPQWQYWLGDAAPDLLDALQKHLKISKSCNSNKEKMLEINEQLRIRNKTKEFIDFLRTFFPMVLIPIADKKIVKQSQQDRKKLESLNKHGIFKIFKPHLLMFPQKHIIRKPDQKKLITEVRKFVKTKISVDYIIVEDTAYIEFFSPQYAQEADKISDNKREIFQYRKANKLKEGATHI